MIRTLEATRRRLAEDEGFTLLEVLGALSIMAFGFFALASTASTGARMLVESRQRQSASETASRQIEHLRNVPFDQVALPSALTQSGDPEHPDAHVSSDGLGYDHDGDGSYEDLVIDGAGQVQHFEAFTVGTTAIEAYHYVTWVDDPAIAGTEDYKRVVVVATYDGNPGRPGSVRVSALLTPGTITVLGDDLDPTGGSSSTPSPSPTPTPTGSCSGDTSAPTGTFTLVSGTGAASGFTASTTVTVSLEPADGCTPITVRLSNDNVTYGSATTYDPANPTVTWTIPSGDGVKSVWARFTDGVGNSRIEGPKSITLDQTSPTAPGTLNKSISCTGDDRTVTLTWGAASDANLVAYRVSRSVDNGAYVVIKSTSSLTASDGHKKTLDSVRYRVAAYDKAGNEGPTTNEISLSKNQCS